MDKPIKTDVEVIKDEDIKQESLELTGKAMELEITDQASYDFAGEVRVSLKTARKKLVEKHKKIKAATFAAHKISTDNEKTDLVPIDKADVYLNKLRITWFNQEEAKRRKAQDKLDAQAKAKADREAKKLLAKAEKTEDPKEKAELEEQAEEVYVSPNIATSAVEKTTRHEGGGRTTIIKDIEVEVTDEMKFLAGIVNGNIPITVIEIKPAKVKAWVKTNAIKNGQFESLRITETSRESVRSG